MSSFPITSEGLSNLKNEIDNLKNVERPSIIKAIAEAREHGDLSENAEYHAAREKQSFIEGRILDLEDKLARSVIVDPQSITDSKIRFGATATIIDCDTEIETTYQIVSEYEADVENNLISNTSPIARGLLGKQEGDDVIIHTPQSKKEYYISKVEYK